MNRIFLILLTAALLVSLTACRENETGKQNTEQNTEQRSVSVTAEDVRESAALTLPVFSGSDGGVIAFDEIPD